VRKIEVRLGERDDYVRARIEGLDEKGRRVVEYSYIPERRWWKRVLERVRERIPFLRRRRMKVITGIDIPASDLAEDIPKT
jgi:hypothetical protein